MKEFVLAVVQSLVTALAMTLNPLAGAAERRLVAKARAGDVRAFERLIAERDDVLRALAFRMLGSRDEMDDVLQDAFVRAFRGLERFEGSSSFGTWLYRIVANACLDELRRRGRRSEIGFEQVAERPAPGDGLDDAAGVRLDLAAALAALDPDLRALVLMVDAHGLSYEEAGEIVGIPAGTVASRINRARSALRVHLRPDQGGVHAP